MTAALASPMASSLSPNFLGTLAQSSAVWHDVTRSTATGEHDKSVRAFLRACFYALVAPHHVPHKSFLCVSLAHNVRITREREKSAASSSSGPEEIGKGLEERNRYSSRLPIGKNKSVVIENKEKKGEICPVLYITAYLREKQPEDR